MSKDRKLVKTLRAAMRSEDAIQNPAFIYHLISESEKRKLDPSLFFSNNKKFLRKLKPKH
jgi:hypothetical protein